MQNHYETLGIAASSEEIVVRAAYNALVKKYHPDTYPGDKAFAEERTKAINAAYAILRDPDKRAAYDASLTKKHEPRRSSATGTRSDGNAARSAGTKPNTSRFSENEKAPGGAGKTGSAKNPSTYFPFTGLDWKIPLYGLMGLFLLVILPSIFGESPPAGPPPERNTLGSLSPATPQVAAGAPSKLPAGNEQPNNSISVPVPSQVNWDARKFADPQHYTAGDWNFTLSSGREKDSIYPAPMLDADVKGLPHLHYVGQSGYETAAARIQVLKMNRDDRFPALIFMTYSGGAHCCTAVDIFSIVSGSWKHASTGGDGDVLNALPEDLNGDGRRDIVLRDGQFNYAFAAYSDSDPPPRFFNIVEGELKDVSSDPSFEPFYLKEMVGDQADCLSHFNGGCAAFVAVAARLGLYDWAWQFMLSHFDSDSNWSYPKICDQDTRGLPCPNDHMVSVAFPFSLQYFLRKAGYDNSAAHDGRRATTPSFDCTGVSSAVLTLVCSSPELAAADRTLAAAYFAATHQRGSPPDLQGDQDVWVRLRNNSEADQATLLRLYNQRIGYLTNIAVSLAHQSH